MNTERERQGGVHAPLASSSSFYSSYTHSERPSADSGDHERRAFAAQHNREWSLMTNRIFETPLRQEVEEAFFGLKKEKSCFLEKRVFLLHGPTTEETKLIGNPQAQYMFQVFPRW